MLDLDDLAAGGELPLVTALVTNHNYERFLGAALDSVLAQDYPAERLEIVVVDDGSTDGSRELLADYRARHPERITVIHQANAGNKAAANAAIAASHGRILAMLDADDVWPVEKTTRQVAALLQDLSLGLVYCDQRVIDGEGRELRPSRFAWLALEAQRGSSAAAQIAGPAGNIAVNSTLMFRRELVQHLFPIPLRMTFQDWWIVGWASTLAGIDCVDDVRVGYRAHGANGIFGATGARLLRAEARTVEARRQMLVHGFGDRLSEPDLLAAVAAWEDRGFELAKLGRSAYVELIEATDAEREQAIRFAEEFGSAGDRLSGLRHLVRALACDPTNVALRERLADLEWAIETPAAPIDPELDGLARGVIVLGKLGDLLAEPSLLRGYATTVGEVSDATLAVIIDDTGGRAPMTAMAEAAARAGLTVDALPDVLLLEPDEPAVPAVVRSARAALTERPWEWEPLRLFRPGGIELLERFGSVADAPREPAQSLA